MAVEGRPREAEREGDQSSGAGAQDVLVAEEGVSGGGGEQCDGRGPSGVESSAEAGRERHERDAANAGAEFRHFLGETLEKIEARHMRQTRQPRR